MFLPALLAILTVAVLAPSARVGAIPAAGIETVESETVAARSDSEDERSRSLGGDAAPIPPTPAGAHPPLRPAGTTRLPLPQRHAAGAASFQARAPPAG